MAIPRKNNTGNAGLPVSEPEGELASWLQKIGRVLPGTLSVFDPAGSHLLHVGETVSSDLGYTASELRRLSGAGLLALVHPEDADSVLQLMARVLTAGDEEVLEGECRLRHKNGSWQTLLSRHSVLERDNSGMPARIVSLTENITARRQAEEGLRFISKMPEENPNPVMRLSSEGQILYANQAGAALLEFWEQKGHRILPPKLEKRLRKAWETGKRQEIEVEYQGLTFSCTLAPVLSSGYINFYANDISRN